jgi:tryptophan synthase alpha chain
VDGLLLVDCPPEEMSDLRQQLDANDLYPVYLIAPTTTPERIERIARQARGYLYYVSFKGITGANQLEASGLAGPLSEIRQHTGLPVAVGFGIKDARSAASVAALADAVIIGSALVAQLAQAATEADACDRAASFLAPIRRAMDNDA